MPESSSGLSNVKRVEPETGSVPMLATISPSTARHQPLQQRLARQRSDDAQAKDTEREVRCRRERKGDRRQPLRQQNERDETDQAADDTRVQRDAERFAGTTLLLHRVAIDDGCRGSVGAGRAE